MERTTLDLWVGVFVVAGLAALLALGMKVGNLSTFSMAESYQVNARFGNIGGLKVRAPVKSAGVVIGRVSAISFDSKNYEAVVSMMIDKRYQFSKDASASILTAGLLGEQYIGLETGADVAMLKSMDEIKHTQKAVVLENLIGQFLYSKAAAGEKAKQ